MWLQSKGVYTINGGVLSILRKSDPSRPEPDLHMFLVPGYFKGYFPGYSNSSYIPGDKQHLTWAILKGHTENTAGYVQLRSTNPRDTPYINFKVKS